MEDRERHRDGLADATVVMRVAYLGTGLSGFQRQEGAETVQGRLEDALRVILRRDAVTVGAGRTDAGVHAIGQTVSFSVSEGMPSLAELQRSLAALVGPDITVVAIGLARAGFSARHDALSREYRYRVECGRVPPVFLAPYAWWAKSELDVDAMSQGAQQLLGEHDFRSFCVAESAEGQRTIRRLDRLDVMRSASLGEEYIEFLVEGNAFLHSMVRVIVGSLVEVGRGKRDPNWIGTVLAARDRSTAGPTAPAHGLTLWSVRYPDDVWIDPPR